MLHLMKLEMKKFKLGWYVKGAIITNIIIITLFCLINYIEQIEQTEGAEMIKSFPDAFILIGGMVRGTFIVFAGVLITKLVIEEYKNKTILIMFSYPVNRKKLIASKLLITALLTFTTILISNIVVAGTVFILNSYVPIIPDSITVNEFMKEVIKMVPFAIAAAGTSLIPLYFGMRKYSVPVTILSSLIVVAIACQSQPQFSVVTFIPLQLGLAAIGVMIAYYGIRNIEKEDIA
ncbi:ABC transporter permease [Bacillus sp. DX4.1]|uniref:ABC transporter permease n=1 Tax=Bacillus sp. DX4.1 TaxID=3055867 RepID=UPI0025A19440|nr:ABC transporter permease [Bacillus sp. DX4.1]MDM5190222.1 ABC transporter permease [Bacillus sp. DX4.1]